MARAEIGHVIIGEDDRAAIVVAAARLPADCRVKVIGNPGRQIFEISVERPGMECKRALFPEGEFQNAVAFLNAVREDLAR